MSGLIRFGVSMENGLLNQFDKLIDQKCYANRSEAIRDLVKKTLVESGFQAGDKEVAGTVTLIYPYGTKLKNLHMHDFPSVVILANLQVHLDKNTCLKVLVLRGRASEVRQWAETLLGTKGVLGQFTLSATEDVEGVW